MKTLRFMLTVTVALLACTSVALAAPHAVVEHPVFDFGTVAQGKKVDHVFILKNNGDSMLTIGQVSTSCGCTVADVSSRSVAPGKSSEIHVTFNSMNFHDNVSKNVTVHTNDPGRTIYTLILKGAVIEEIEVSPRQLNLGTIKTGNRKEAALTIENRGKQSVALTSVKSTTPQVTVRLQSTTVKPGEKTEVSISVAPRNNDRFLSGYIIVKTNSQEKPEIIIPLYASVMK
jgi:hypothetical protein